MTCTTYQLWQCHLWSLARRHFFVRGVSYKITLADLYVRVHKLLFSNIHTSSIHNNNLKNYVFLSQYGDESSVIWPSKPGKPVVIKGDNLTLLYSLEVSSCSRSQLTASIWLRTARAGAMTPISKSSCSWHFSMKISIACAPNLFLVLILLCYYKRPLYPLIF